MGLGATADRLHDDGSPLLLLLALGALDVLDRLGLGGGGCREDAGAMWTASISSSVSPTTHTPPQKEPEGSLAKGAAHSESGGKQTLKALS